MFYLEDITALIGILVRHTFIQFGDSYVHQICGIPIGTSPAPFMANLFLGQYEVVFMRNLRLLMLAGHPHAGEVVAAFKSTRRFLDDMHNLDNRFAACIVHHQHALGHTRHIPRLPEITDSAAWAQRIAFLGYRVSIWG